MDGAAMKDDGFLSVASKVYDKGVLETVGPLPVAQALHDFQGFGEP
jgi:hypothetical protein